MLKKGKRLKTKPFPLALRILKRPFSPKYAYIKMQTTKSSLKCPIPANGLGTVLKRTWNFNFAVEK